MSEQGQQSTVDQIGHAAKSAARMGKEAAQAGKAVSKAAAQAATGNVAGAAVTALKNKTTRRALIITILLPFISFFMVCVLFLYALPTAIYAELTSYFTDVQEEWNIEVYGSDKDIAWESAWASFRAGGRVITDAAKGIWNAIVSLFSSTENDDTGSGNSLSDDGTELMITVDEAAEIETTQRKIDTCLNKLNSRAAQLDKAVRNSKSSLAAALRAYYNNDGKYRSFSIDISVSHTTAEQKDAIVLLSLYTVQTGGSVEELRTSDFMKWLGWYDSRDTSPVYFQPIVGLAAQCSIKGWNGTFMPQYLMEQLNQELAALGDEPTKEEKEAVRARYENNMAPATDLLLFVDAPSLADIEDMIIVSHHRDEIPIWDMVVVDEATQLKERQIVDYEIDEYDTASLSFHIEIGMRSAQELIPIVGLWSDGFVEDAA